MLFGTVTLWIDENREPGWSATMTNEEGLTVYKAVDHSCASDALGAVVEWMENYEFREQEKQT